MKCMLLTLAAVLLTFGICRAASPATVPSTQSYRPNPALPRFVIQPGLPTLWLIGDSTIRCNSDDGRGDLWGWGTPLAQFFDLSKINLQNLAVGGTSSRTFRTYGFWQPIVQRIKPGDLLLIQFGHNDASKINDDSRARGTLPGLGDETVDIDNLLTGHHETVHTYGWYIRQYIAEARAAGVRDIFVCSPVPKNAWIDGHLDRKWNADYVRWAEQLATQTQTHFVPLNQTASDEYESLGQEKVTATLYAPKEAVHTSWLGAVLNARCVVAGLRDANVPAVRDALLAGPPEDPVPPAGPPRH